MVRAGVAGPTIVSLAPSPCPRRLDLDLIWSPSSPPVGLTAGWAPFSFDCLCRVYVAGAVVVAIAIAPVLSGLTKREIVSLGRI